MLIDRRLISYFDWSLFAAIMAVPCIGLIVLYSAGYDPELGKVNLVGFAVSTHSQAFTKQFIFLGVGLCGLLVALAIPPAFWHRYAYFLYGALVIMLAIVLKFGVVANGSRRWFDLGPLHLQPAEVMKLALILTLARYLSKNPPKAKGYTLIDLLPPLGIILVPMALVIRQPDLGTALVIGGVGFMMVLFMGVNLRTLLFMVLAVAVSAYPAWSMLYPYQQRRIVNLFNPDADPLGSGYHIIQSKIAVGSGAIFGKGFLKGTQSQLEFLPEHTTDFIFSVLAEEWGFFGAALVLTLYMVLIFRVLRVVAKSKDLFSTLVAFGVCASLLCHSIINIGMVVGLLPVVGIPLPLFSYGGSSVVSFLFSLGLVLGISMRRSVFALKL